MLMPASQAGDTVGINHVDRIHHVGANKILTIQEDAGKVDENDKGQGFESASHRYLKLNTVLTVHNGQRTLMAFNAL